MGHPGLIAYNRMRGELATILRWLTASDEQDGWASSYPTHAQRTRMNGAPGLDCLQSDARGVGDDSALANCFG
jgi:hypothetical protein